MQRPKYGIYDAERRGYITARGSLAQTGFPAVVFDEPSKARDFARKVGAPKNALIVVMDALDDHDLPDGDPETFWPTKARWECFRHRFADRLLDILTTPGIGATAEELAWVEWARIGIQLTDGALSQRLIADAFVASLQDARLHTVPREEVLRLVFRTIR